jgi:NADH dehydrogenase
MLRALERAETTDDAAERTALLTFVIVGAGPTGVELAGVLPTIIRNAARRAYRHIDPSEVRVVLFEGGERVLPAFDTALSDRARRDLESLGVEVRTGTLVTDVRPDGVSVGEEWIPARTTLWAAGNEASPLVRSLGAPLDRAGRALVKPDLSVPGLPEVFVIGDAAAAEVRPSAEADARSWQGPGKDVPQGTSAAPGAEPTYVPGVAPAATQMGQHVAATIRRALHGEPRQPFYYRDKGNLAVIGRGSAVAEFGGLKLTGPVAWATWLFVHVLYLVGFRNRAVVLVSWAYSYLGNRPNAALITSDVPDDTPVARPNHPGQTSRFSTASRNSMKKTTPKKTTPPRQDPAEIRETIDPDSNVEQASLESFPASDAPGYTGAEATPGGSGSYSAEDAEKARARDTASGEEDAPAEDDL